jgi:hypothetical protein
MKNKNFTKELLLEYGYIFFLFNVATLIPMLDLLGEQFTFFTAHELKSEFIIYSICLFAFGIPLLFSIIRYCFKKLKLVKYFDVGFIAFFLTLYFLHIINKSAYGLFSTEVEVPLYFSISIILSMVLTPIIIRKDYLKTLSILSFIVPITILYFIFLSPASVIFNVEKTQDIVISAKNPTPVYIIVFDEFSGLTLQTKTRVLDKKRYPNWAALLDDSDYFPNALTTNTITNKAIPSILTGNSSDENGLLSANNLLATFASMGPINSYSKVVPADLNTFESWKSIETFSTDLLTIYFHLLTHKEWAEEYLGTIPETWANFGLFKSKSNWSFYGASSFDPWISMAIESGTSFNFLHILFPHGPYGMTPSGKSSWAPSEILEKSKTKENFEASQTYINVVYHSYMLQAAYTDKMIGQFITELKRKGIYKKSLIIVTADHGVSYDKTGVSRRQLKTRESWANIISVPLIIKYPQSDQGRTVNTVVTSLDIVPTIFSVLGINPVWKTDGENLDKLIKPYSKSVQFVPQIETYKDSLASIFSSSLEKKYALFGEGISLSDRLVNYTNHSDYDRLLGSDISDFNRHKSSQFSAFYNGNTPSDNEMVDQSGNLFSGTFDGVLLEDNKPINGKVLIAVLNNTVVAISETSKVKNKDGAFAFGITEGAWKSTGNDFNLYALDMSTTPFSLNRIEQANKSRRSLAREFFNLTPIDFDWKKAIAGHSEHASDFDQAKYGHKINTSGDDAYLIFKPIFSKPTKGTMMLIDIESDKETTFSVLYKSSNNQTFSAKRTLNFLLRKGDNSFYVKFPEELSGHFRLDLGLLSRNEVLIKNIEIRAPKTNN